MRTLSIKRAKTGIVTSTSDVQLSEPYRLPADWQEVHAPEGKYYHNVNTGEVRANYFLKRRTVTNTERGTVRR